MHRPAPIKKDKYVARPVATITPEKATDLDHRILEAGPDCYRAWETLKDKLYNIPTLAFPDFDRPFILYTDSSKEKGYRAALYQLGADGVERPILFLSRDISGAETLY